MFGSPCDFLYRGRASQSRRSFGRASDWWFRWWCVVAFGAREILEVEVLVVFGDVGVLGGVVGLAEVLGPCAEHSAFQIIEGFGRSGTGIIPVVG